MSLLLKLDTDLFVSAPLLDVIFS